MDFTALIEQNNASHVVEKAELSRLTKEANEVFKQNHSSDVWFERSIFINWTCAIADCKYCYLSTTPKKDMNAIRSKESILAEALICKKMGWEVGYITGGLRVEPNEYIQDLLEKLNKVLGEKTMMNFGPYNKEEVNSFKPYVTGMGSAIESFDETLHKFICPSKPLKALKAFLGFLKDEDMKKLITIILGMGEKMSDVDEVIANIKKYNIEKVQLCFLKPQDATFFKNVPPPDPDYMAWWIAKLRIACPDIIIKIALVKERIADIKQYLDAGANCFSRFMVFDDFATDYAEELVNGCKAANRNLKGHWLDLPELDIEQGINQLDLDDQTKAKMLPKAKQYYKKLKKKLQ